MIQTTVVGNYPRIGDRHELQKLRRALAQRDRGELSGEDLARVEDEVTREVLEEQAKAGTSLVTDGQIRWGDAQTYIAGNLEGIKITGLLRYFDSNTYFRQPVVEGPVRWKRPILVRDFQFAKEHSSRPVKPVLTGPLTLARLSSDRHYSSPETLTCDYARALAEEISALEDAGADPIQIDEPAAVWWPEDAALLEKAIGILAGGRKRSRLGLYTYFRGPGKLLGLMDSLPIEILGLDLVAGEGDIDAIEKSPPRKILSLGILDARNTKLEDEEERAALARRLRQATGAEEMYIHPNCGLEFLPRESAVRKLELLSRIAARAEQEEK
ncbi:MAG: methylcobamide--CoM methyltransferase [Acidobacteriota bacterium]